MTENNNPWSTTAAEVQEKIDRARKAQAGWAALSYGERARGLQRAARYCGSHLDEVTEAIRQSCGKLKIDAIVAEVLPAVLALDYYIRWGKKFLASRSLKPGNLFMAFKRSRIIYKPYGVVGIISPWNYPFAIPFSEAVMALLAGNGVILKVASDTLEAGRALAAVFAAADLPPDLFTYVEIPGREAGPAFISGGVDKLCFTGSTEIGRELMALAAPRLLPLVLELGGADAAVICADADLDRAAAGIIWAGFSNAGQSCGGIQRVLVHEKAYKPFLEKLCARTEQLRIGDGLDADLGPMISLRQKKTVQKQVAACTAAGAVIAAKSPGDPNDDSLWAPAMVLTHVSGDMPVLADEVFGPVVAVLSAPDDDAAIRMANASPYALNGSVWSRNHARAKALAARLNAGAVMINDHLMSHGLAETPWGGFGNSGIGRTHGEMGFREMCKAQVIVNDILPRPKRNPWWQPYSEDSCRQLQAFTDIAAKTAFSKKLTALPHLLKMFLRFW
jgi:succinate-semialdehyde dehydrogenase/glutarate-semialdehyde dehydrogenase